MSNSIVKCCECGSDEIMAEGSKDLKTGEFHLSDYFCVDCGDVRDVVFVEVENA